MGRRRYEPEFPKPFDFVSFNQAVDKEKHPGHESFHLAGSVSGQLTYAVKIMTPMHISSGSYALSEDLGLPAGHVVRDFYRIPQKGTQLPAIPGSSLKGSARAIVEAVTNSCLTVTRVSRKDLPDNVARSCRPPSLCPACALFGAMSQYARVQFSDAHFKSGDAGIMQMPSLFRPRPKESYVYKQKDEQYKGRKFYFHGRPARHPDGTYVEILKPGTILEGVVNFTGLSQAEFGLLLWGLGCDGSFQAAIGGGKPMAMGRMQVQPLELRLQQTASFTEYETGDAVWEGESLPEIIADTIKRAEPLIVNKQRDELRAILDPANTRPAPTGVY